MTNGIGGRVARILLSSAIALATVAAFGVNKTTAEAQKSAYDSYNSNATPETVTVTGIVVSQQRRYDSTLVPKLQQEGVSFGALVIQDPTATRNLGGTLYSNAIKVVFNNNYGSIPSGTVFPLSLADRQLYGYPKEGDKITVTGLAKISYDTISAVFPLTIADEAIIDMSDTTTFPIMTIVSENNVVTPLAVTPSTFTAPPFSKLANSGVAGLLDTHSRKGVSGFGQGNLIPHPLNGMLVTLTGRKYDMTNPKNTQPSYLNGKVGFMVADMGASDPDSAASVFVNTRSSLATGETPIPIDASLLAPGSTDPVTGVVNSHLLIAGTSTYNVAGITVRRQGDIPSGTSPTNTVSYVTVDFALNNAPIPGGQVDITLTGLEANPDKGLGTVTADLSVLGELGATDLSNNPIADVALTPVSPGSNTYKGSFKIASPARKGYLTPIIHYVNNGADIWLDTSHVFSPVLNAVPYRSAAALRHVMNGLPDGFPVAIDSSIPGTVNPIVTCDEQSGASYLSSSSQFFCSDPFAPAGLNVFMSDGNKATPKVVNGDAVNIAGTLLTFQGRREITSRLAWVSVVSFSNPLPPAILMNTNDVSEDFNDPTFNDAGEQRVPASLCPDYGTYATVVCKVTAATSALLPSSFPQQIDADDGTGPIVIKLDNRYTDAKALTNLRTWATTGSTLIVTGVCAVNTRTISGVVTNVRTFWVKDEKSIIKAPTLNTVNVTVPGGRQLVSLPAPPDPQLQMVPTIIPGGLAAARLYNGVTYTGAPAGSDPWWKGLQFLRLTEGYKITGTPANFSYTGLTSGTGTALDGTTQAFDLDTLPRYYGLYNTNQDQLVGISYTGNTVLWDEDGPANQFYGYNGGAMESMFGGVGTTINIVKDDAGSTVTAPHTFVAAEPVRLSQVGTVSPDALVLFPTAVNNTCDLSLTIQPEALFSGSIAGYPVEVQLRYPGSTVAIQDVFGNLDGSGVITLSAVPAGLYDVWIWVCGFLADCVPGVSVTNPCATGTIVATGPDSSGVITGDAATTNQVGLFSLNSVLIAFGTPDICPIDTDGNGFIDLGDLNIVLINFGKKGCQ